MNILKGFVKIYLYSLIVAGSFYLICVFGYDLVIR